VAYADGFEIVVVWVDGSPMNKGSWPSAGYEGLFFVAFLL
jgi:hypothetical protein